MPLVLAIEPDLRQAAILKRVVRDKVHADLAVVDSRDAAVAALAAQIPDVLLLSALLSPRDEDELVSHLRTLGGAEHLQTHTIPQLATTAADRPDQGRGGLFKAFRKKKEPDAISGCDPDLFALEITTFLQRAAEMKAEAATMQQTRANEIEFRARTPEADAAHPAAMPALAPAAEDPNNAWASPFEWRATPSRFAARTADGQAEAAGDPSSASETPSVEGAADVDALAVAAAAEPVEAAPVEAAPVETALVEAALVEAAPVEEAPLGDAVFAPAEDISATSSDERGDAAAEIAEAAADEIPETTIESIVYAEPEAAAHAKAGNNLEASSDEETASHRDEEPLAVVEAVASTGEHAEPAAAAWAAADPEEQAVAGPIWQDREPAPAMDDNAVLAAQAPPSLDEPSAAESSAAAAEPESAPPEAPVVAMPARGRRKKRAAKPVTPAAAVLRLTPLAMWARFEQDDRKPQPAPAAATASDELRALFAGLAVPPQIAAVSYGHGARIRRVRVPGGRERRRGAVPGPVILSRKALEEGRL